MLTNFQQTVVEFVTQQRDEARRRFLADSDRDVRDQLKTAAIYAHALHRDLTAQGRAPQMPEEIISKSEAEPNDPEFYYHLHRLDAFLIAVASLE